MTLKKISLCIVLLSSGFAYTQEKSIPAKSVTERIHIYMNMYYPTVKKIHYYSEKINETEVIECDFNINKNSYSVKFQPDGTYIETEKSLNFKEFTPEIQIKITSALTSNFTNYKIFSCEQIMPDTKYEIKVRGKQNKKKGSFEVYFDKDGELLEIKQIIHVAIPSLF